MCALQMFPYFPLQENHHSPKHDIKAGSFMFWFVVPVKTFYQWYSTNGTGTVIPANWPPYSQGCKIYQFLYIFIEKPQISLHNIAVKLCNLEH